MDAYIDTGAFGLDESDGLDTIYGCFGGYLMLNLSILRKRAARTPGTSPETMERLLLGQHSDVPPYRVDPADEAPERHASIRAQMDSLLRVTKLPQLDEDAALVRRIRATRGDLTALSDRALVDRARDIAKTVRQIYPRHVLMSTGAGAGDGMLRRACAAVDREALVVGFVSGIGGVDSVAPVHGLWELSRIARRSPRVIDAFESGGTTAVTTLMSDEADNGFDGFRAGLQNYLAEYGYRGPAEWDPGADSWQTRPELVLWVLNGMRRAPDDRKPSDPGYVTEHDQLRAEFLASQPDSATIGLLDTGLRVSALYLAGRERSKTNLMILVNEMRLALRELGRRHLDDGADIAMLHNKELDDFVADPASFETVINERTKNFEKLRQLEPPFVIDTAPPPLSQWPLRTNADTIVRAQPGETICGLAGSPGTVIGRARILHDSGEVDRVLPGDVLITPTTDPAWTPALLVAAAIVVETGSVLSHAVIVSRELGTPCVVSLADATARVRDGDRILVDGGRGTVTVL
ncbi:PEP-utilizing enzyme [Nocardia sp. NPDC052278]|uniref:PEP-utilizing enzyme n=1 Tax=unclassified Nocardia TaxID=2637762 RepID=UPI00369D34D5